VKSTDAFQTDGAMLASFSIAAELRQKEVMTSVTDSVAALMKKGYEAKDKTDVLYKKYQALMPAIEDWSVAGSGTVWIIDNKERDKEVESDVKSMKDALTYLRSFNANGEKLQSLLTGTLQSFSPKLVEVSKDLTILIKQTSLLITSMIIVEILFNASKPVYAGNMKGSLDGALNFALSDLLIKKVDLPKQLLSRMEGAIGLAKSKEAGAAASSAQASAGAPDKPEKKGPKEKEAKDSKSVPKEKSKKDVVEKPGKKPKST
jgi:hypothetical protein